jgi:glycosyltransferase involved in cell wall biosynthesis
MKVSIITVAYNSALTIADTLESVASQSYRSVEHVVIDGGSTDRTKEIVGRCGGHIAKFISEPDRGIYDAMNKGLALATGEVICFLNADDVYVDENVIGKVVDLMENKELDALFGDVEFFRPKSPKRTFRRYRSRKFNPRRISRGWMPAHPSLFIRDHVFERFGFFNSDYQIAGDFEFVARVFRDDTLKYSYLPEVMVRMRTGGISTGGLRNTLLLNREVLRACRQNGIPTNILLVLSRYPEKLLEFLSK